MTCGQTRKFALVVVLAAAWFVPANAKPGSCTPIRVMTYNIRLDLESDGPDRWNARHDQFIGQVDFIHPDILGLQEVVEGQRQDLMRGLPDYDFLGVARDDGHAAGEYSNLAVDRSRYVVASSGTFWLSPTPDRPSKGWDAAYRRIATWAHLRDRRTGQRILALNTHLDNEGATARREGAQMIREFLTKNHRSGERVIATGDFNSVPNADPYRALSEAPLGLRDSRLASRTPPVGPEGTFNAFTALPATSDRIDYIFVDPALQVRRSVVPAWHGEGGRTASDHFPVVADLADCP